LANSYVHCVIKLNAEIYQGTFGYKTEDLIDAGWLEWVKERKSLEEKFISKLHGTMKDGKGENVILWTSIISPKEQAKIAKEHEKKKHLEAFDEASKKLFGHEMNYTDNLRKALEDA